LILLIASAIPVPADDTAYRSEGDSIAEGLATRFSLSGTPALDPHPRLNVLPGTRSADPAAGLIPTRLESGLRGTRDQSPGATGDRKRSRLSGELGIGYAAFTTKGIGGGIRYGMAFLAMASPRIGFEVALERLKAPVDGDVDPLGLGKGTLYVTPLSVNMQHRWPEMGRFTPYALLGVGFHFALFLPEEGDEDVADRLALILGGGVDTRIGRNVTLHTGLKFTPIPTWVQAKGSNPEPDDQNKIWINPFTLTLGIKYYFE
jgi:outer membrane protein W